MTDFTNGIDHAEQCGGVPVIVESHSEWSATCWHATDAKQCGWEVTGCESRAEAGVFFYGARMDAGRIVFDGDAS